MYNNEDLKRIIGSGERILFELKPDKKCFIFESIFNPLLPFAIIWGLFDLFFIAGLLSSVEEKGFLAFIIPFFLLHLMPVWIYLAGVLFSVKRYRNTNYIITDKAIYISGGIFNKTFQNKPFAELSHVDLHRGIFDQMFNVGDIVCTTSQVGANGVHTPITINSIENYVDVYNLVKKLQTDIYTDVMYPND